MVAVSMFRTLDPFPELSENSDLELTFIQFGAFERLWELRFDKNSGDFKIKFDFILNISSRFIKFAN